MVEVIYRSSIGDRLAKLVVSCAIVYGAFYAGQKLSEFKQNSVPYALMHNKGQYYIIDKKTDAFRRIDDSIFEKVNNNDSNDISNKLNQRDYLPITLHK